MHNGIQGEQGIGVRLTQMNGITEEIMSGGSSSEGEVYGTDVVKILPELIRRYAGKVQLIYLDPPFMTGEKFVMRVRVGEGEWRTGNGTLVRPAYDDDLGLEAYLRLMRETLEGAKALLSETGVIYVHVDMRAYVHVRLLMDEIFGANNLLNEIVWSYQTGGRAKRFFSRKHDTILFYRKSKKYYFNIEAVPISRTDTRRNHMKRHVDADGRVYRSIRSGGKVYTYYDDDPAYPGDVWDDVSHLQQKDPTRTGYDTQKPLRLLERIVLSSSRPGDLVCDLFAGSGTTLEAAWLNGRRFLGVDRSDYALQTMRRRLDGAQCAWIAASGAGSPAVSLDVEPGIAFFDVKLTGYSLEKGLCDRVFNELDAVDNWAVGYFRDGVFVRQAASFRTRTSPALETTLELPVLGGQMGLRIEDVLGRRFYFGIGNPGEE
ncbi:MAG: site-specific DNA-methyltransferase [Clostridia bacterium]|nr:site-specific DNA-methyltransferase [Clostridia bacterium]